MEQEVDNIVASRGGNHESEDGGDAEGHKQFAASTWLQCVELTRRLFRQQWRDPSYIELEDAIISSLGVEQRKRLTIGVELAAKPSLLLFLDEPTSGLDSQSAYSIVRFLKEEQRGGESRGAGGR